MSKQVFRHKFLPISADENFILIRKTMTKNFMEVHYKIC